MLKVRWLCVAYYILFLPRQFLKQQHGKFSVGSAQSQMIILPDIKGRLSLSKTQSMFAFGAALVFTRRSCCLFFVDFLLLCLVQSQGLELPRRTMNEQLRVCKPINLFMFSNIFIIRTQVGGIWRFHCSHQILRGVCDFGSKGYWSKAGVPACFLDQLKDPHLKYR